MPKTGKDKTEFEASLMQTDDRALENSTLIVTTCTSFIAPFMISAVNVALPAIQADYKIDAVVLSWIATSYLLARVVLLVPVGQIADICGRKKIFMAGLLLFVSASFLSALATTITVLILLRVLQGFGAAMVGTTGMAILTSVFPPQRRGRAIGIYVAAVYLGLSVGPTFGGTMTHHFGWRSIFLAVVPLGLAAIFITARYLKKEWKGSSGEKFDLTGSLLYVVSLMALSYAALRLPHPSAWLTAAAGMAGLWLFVSHEKSIRFPVFEVRLFQNNRIFAFSGLAALINYAATFAVTFLLSLYLQFVKGLNPQTTGLILVFQPIIQALFSPLTGKLSDRIEPRILASAGMGLTALGLLQLAFLGPATPVSYIVGVLIMLGSGFALFSSPNVNALMSAVEKKHYSRASGAVATMRLLGQMVSMVTVTVVFTLFLGDKPMLAANHTLFLQSLRIVFLIFTLLCLLGIFFSMARGMLRE